MRKIYVGCSGWHEGCQRVVQIVIKKIVRAEDSGRVRLLAGILAGRRWAQGDRCLPRSRQCPAHFVSDGVSAIIYVSAATPSRARSSAG